MFSRILYLTFLLMLLLGDGQVKYRIVSLSTPDIMIGSQKMKKGDVFDSGETIHWTDNVQVMRVIDVETEEVILLSKTVQEVALGHDDSDYKKIYITLATNSKAMAESAERGGYHYITYADGRRNKKVRLERGLFMDEYPYDLTLWYHDPVKSADVRLTDDFRSFVDDLIITDHMVKQRLSQVDYCEGEDDLMRRDYMLMMYTYGDERFREIRYTYDDLKMFLTLKY